MKEYDNWFFQEKRLWFEEKKQSRQWEKPLEKLLNQYEKLDITIDSLSKEFDLPEIATNVLKSLNRASINKEVLLSLFKSPKKTLRFIWNKFLKNIKEAGVTYNTNLIKYSINCQENILQKAIQNNETIDTFLEECSEQDALDCLEER